ncbi:MAG: hypothetical protein BWY85_00339 [Firmicutes bacterium ADurb.Bin506]|nr:MAG: hypothetical protein BWY85_00339 [Firmicutes bacterium ADurb.Bin506]
MRDTVTDLLDMATSDCSLCMEQALSIAGLFPLRCRDGTVYALRQRSARRVPLLSAHLDTHPSGVGYDDRIGVAVIAYLARHTDLEFGALLSVGEETGKSSARHVWSDVGTSVSCAIVLDRRGTSDIVTRVGHLDTCDEEFAAAMVDSLAQYGYAPTEGKHSDVVPLSLRIGNAVNLSVGFSREHTPHERVDWEHVERLPDIVTAAIEAAYGVTDD